MHSCQRRPSQLRKREPSFAGCDACGTPSDNPRRQRAQRAVGDVQQVQRHPGLALDARRHIDSHQRMAADIEEVVAGANACEAQQFLPQRGKQLLVGSLGLGGAIDFFLAG